MKDELFTSTYTVTLSLVCDVHDNGVYKLCNSIQFSASSSETMPVKLMCVFIHDIHDTFHFVKLAYKTADKAVFRHFLDLYRVLHFG